MTLNKDSEPVDRRIKGNRIEAAAPASLLTKLSNINTWRDELLFSGLSIREVPVPSSLSHIAMEQRSEILTRYQRERRDYILNKLTNAEIGNYCREYGLTIEGRKCPSYF